MNNQPHNLSPHLKELYDFGHSGVLHVSVKATDGELRQQIEALKEGDEVELDQYYHLRGEVSHNGVGFKGDAVGEDDEGNTTVEYLIHANFEEREHILCLSDYIVKEHTDLVQPYFILGSEDHENEGFIHGLSKTELWHHQIDTGNGLFETVDVEQCYLTNGGDYTTDPDSEDIKEGEENHPTYKISVRKADLDKFDWKEFREFAPASEERFIQVRALISEEGHGIYLEEIDENRGIVRYHGILPDDTSQLPHHIADLDEGEWVKFASRPEDDFQVVGYDEADGRPVLLLNFYRDRSDKLFSASRYDWRIYTRLPEFQAEIGSSCGIKGE